MIKWMFCNCFVIIVVAADEVCGAGAERQYFLVSIFAGGCKDDNRPSGNVV